MCRDARPISPIQTKQNKKQKKIKIQKKQQEQQQNPKEQTKQFNKKLVSEIGLISSRREKGNLWSNFTYVLQTACSSCPKSQGILEPFKGVVTDFIKTTLSKFFKV